MQGLRLPICGSCRSCGGSLSLSVTVGEVTNALMVGSLLMVPQKRSLKHGGLGLKGHKLFSPLGGRHGCCVPKPRNP